MIKIAYFIDRILYGGTELQLIEQINRLSIIGFDQDLFCLYKSNNHDNINIKCRVHIMDVRSLTSFHAMNEMYNIVNYLKIKKIGLVQTYFFDSTVFGVTAANLAGVKTVISCRRDMGFWYTPKFLRVLRFMNRFTNRILTNCQVVADNVAQKEKLNKRKLDVINNGIDVDFYRRNAKNRDESRRILNLSERDIAVGIIANMDRGVKRVDLFVEAARKLIDTDDRLHFFAMGDGHLKNELIDVVKKENREKRIQFLDNKSISKFVLLSALDIGVICSDSEGFSNSILEYMATGIPVVATNVGGNTELIANLRNGVLVRPGDVEELSDAILSYAKDKEFRIYTGSNSSNDVKKYDWGNVIKEVNNYYTNLSIT